MKLLLLLVACLLLGRAAFAAEARPLYADPAVEQRMLSITGELRCLVCQDESLADSQAELARDLRAEVRGLIRKGLSDHQIVAYLVQRYGNYVRYRPPFDAETLLLWLGPFALLAVGLLVLLTQIRAGSTRAAGALDEATLQRARELLSRAGDAS
ncbi:cytochrome c-type biogenesis protein [Thiomonas sp.]|jgi:cytochrome c-type biogenesis protein CcmH|uniref:cytochrome c-type biogenesis protein n=1 Tax=Thiomonas sp. TaxID=2047785 RepID=UPI002635041B|nr:cytochrome c-type biogenesis protein [Thiomonas sp.]